MFHIQLVGAFNFLFVILTIYIIYLLTMFKFVVYGPENFQTIYYLHLYTQLYIQYNAFYNSKTYLLLRITR